MNGKYMADTNVITKLLKADAHSVELFDKADEIRISAVVAGELLYGAVNSSRKQENLDLFLDFLSQYAIVDVDLSISRAYGEIKAQLKRDGYTIPENDIWIAATAKVHGYTLMTYDVHFSYVSGLQTVS